MPAIFTGQVKIVSTGVLQQLPDIGPLYVGVDFIAPITNTGVIGLTANPAANPALDGTGGMFIVSPGGLNVAIPAKTLAGGYMSGNAGDFISYIAV